MSTWKVMVRSRHNDVRLFSVRAFDILEAAKIAQAILREDFTVVSIVVE